jgi:nucleotide-binding universal stress UspA family protein
MYKNILIATDGSELAEKALRDGISLGKAIGAKITVLTVTIPFHIFTTNVQMIEDIRPQYNKRMEEQAANILGAAVDAAKAAGIACDTVHVEHEHPYQAIIDTAVSNGCDLIEMASHGRRGVSAILIGSETLKVLTHSKIPVLVHR